jgi:uncharacterized membrane protein
MSTPEHMAGAIRLPIWGSLPVSAKRKALLIVFVLTFFLFLVLGFVFSYHIAASSQLFSPALAPLVSYQAEFVMAIALLGIAVGAFVFYLSLGMIESKQKELVSSAALLLKFLSDEEREVVQLLLSQRGRAYQSEIARLPGMSRIQAHRVVKKLLARSLVAVRRAGRVNVLELAPELLDGLQQKN